MVHAIDCEEGQCVCMAMRHILWTPASLFRRYCLPSTSSTAQRRFVQGRQSSPKPKTRKTRKKWTEEEVRTLTRLRDEGHGNREMARQLPGRTLCSVRLRLRRLLTKRVITRKLSPMKITAEEDERIRTMLRSGRSRQIWTQMVSLFQAEP